MHYILLFGLVVLFFFVYYFEGKRVMHPACLAILVFIISSAVFALNAEKWETQIRLDTVVLIFTALFVFWLGTRLKIKVKKNIAAPRLSNENCCFQLKKPLIFTLFFLGLAVDYLIYRRAMQIVAGYPTGSYVLRTLRQALATDQNWGLHISIIREGYYGIGYSCIFVYFVNIIYSRNKKWYKWNYILLPVIPMLVAMYLSTGRTGIIRVFGFAIIILFTLITYRKKIKLSRFMRYGLALFIVLLFVFFQFGKSTGKSQVFGVFDTLSIYIGSSIGALNSYIFSPSSNSNSIGGETLYGIRHFIRYIIPELAVTPIPLPFHYVAHGYNTNVYTALRRYINDFGYIGMYLIIFIQGSVFGNWDRYLRKTKAIGLSLILYGYFMYDVLMIAIEENFLRELLTVAQIFIVAVFYFFYKYVIKPSYVKE